MGNTSAFVFQNDQSDWYSRHAEKVIASILTRMSSGELDKYPGYARWNGDGIPGMMQVWNSHSSTIGILAVGCGSGQRLGCVYDLDNSASRANQEVLFRALAKKLGYSVRKK